MVRGPFITNAKKKNSADVNPSNDNTTAVEESFTVADFLAGIMQYTVSDHTASRIVQAHEIVTDQLVGSNMQNNGMVYK
jgi:hypothetical protein